MTTLVLTAVLQTSLMAAPEQGYMEALSRSMASGRALVVLVGADWCPGCVKMHGRILPEVGRKGGLDRVELAYVDVDREPQLAQQLMRGGSIPQLVRFEKTDSGWRSEVLTGAQSPDRVAAFINGEPEPQRSFPGVLSSWTEKLLGR
ncbi:MAG: thioredoxin family protein [Rhodopirellula sp.]|nr:thioredoxin family protein [Rhodopirellula sp.]